MGCIEYFVPDDIPSPLSCPWLLHLPRSGDFLRSRVLKIPDCSGTQALEEIGNFHAMTGVVGGFSLWAITRLQNVIYVCVRITISRVIGYLPFVACCFTY
jgi:hypothetical protein